MKSTKRCVNIKSAVIILIIAIFQIVSVSSKGKFKFKHLKSRQDACNQWSGPLTSNDKQVILNAHNWFRNQIALQSNTMGPRLPFATNMLQMYWSDAIAMKAQIHANNCKFMHSTRDFRKQPDFPTGENIYQTASGTNFQQMDWNKTITAWFSEIKDFGGKKIESLETGGATTGHFTQVIWANSYLVGCAFAQYKSGPWFTSLYVCQYGPVGNVVGAPIYSGSTHKACVCPQETSCSNVTYPGLCCPHEACTWQTQVYSGPSIPGTIPANLTYGY